MESPSLEALKTQLDKVLGNLLLLTLLEQKVGLDDLKKSLLTSAILWFCASTTRMNTNMSMYTHIEFLRIKF